MADKRYICQRRLLGKTLYVNAPTHTGVRNWSYAQRPERARRLTAAQAALFQSDMDYLRAPSACVVAQSNEGLAGPKRRRTKKKRR